jgi:hypothetical protein
MRKSSTTPPAPAAPIATVTAVVVVVTTMGSSRFPRLSSPYHIRHGGKLQEGISSRFDRHGCILSMTMRLESSALWSGVERVRFRESGVRKRKGGALCALDFSRTAWPIV